MLELLKLVVQPVILRRDESGKAIGEEVGPQASFYSVESIAEYIADLEAQVAAANEATQEKQ